MGQGLCVDVPPVYKLPRLSPVSPSIARGKVTSVVKVASCGNCGGSARTESQPEDNSATITAIERIYLLIIDVSPPFEIIDLTPIFRPRLIAGFCYRTCGCQSIPEKCRSRIDGLAPDSHLRKVFSVAAKTKKLPCLSPRELFCCAQKANTRLRVRITLRSLVAIAARYFDLTANFAAS